MGWFYIAATLLLTVYGNLIFKWQVGLSGGIPSGFPAKLGYFVSVLLNPWVISSFVAALLAAIAWIGALNHFELSYAYPFISLSFALVLVFSVILFGETVSLPKIIGIALIILGVAISSRG